MKLPMFTAKDEQLIRGGSKRDPLGLMPVWTAVGRELIPNLASGVNQTEGVQSVALIYACYPLVCNTEQLEGAWSFRSFFRVMEQILEKFLFDNITRKNGIKVYCYGKRALSASQLFITPDNYITMANGLYQFYRGASRRSSIITQDLLDITSEYKKYFEDNPIPEHFITGIRDMLTKLKSNNKVDGGAFLKPYTEWLQQFYKEKKIREKLGDGLLPEGTCRKAAELYYQNTGKNRFKLMQKLIARCQVLHKSKNDEDYGKIEQILQNTVNCEIWLCSLLWVFEWMQSKPQYSLDDLVNELQPYQSFINSSAETYNKFLRPSSGNSSRFDKVEELSKLALSDYKQFLIGLVEYHTEVMDDRGEESMLILDAGSKLLVPEPIQSDDVWVGAEQRWRNDYYYSPARSLYGQLFGDN